jgi:LysM repeat protein
VSAGDTIAKIAERFGVSQETLLWANGLANPNSLSVRQALLILPVNGVSYQVRAGDSLSSIATQYGVTASAIAEYNNPGATDILQVGQTLVIPGGRPAPATTVPTTTPVPTATPPPTATRVLPTAAPKPPTATPRNCLFRSPCSWARTLRGG